MSDNPSAARSRQERFDRGMEVIDRVIGERGHAFLDRLADVSPELRYQIAAWAFGELYQRPALAPRDRQLVTLAVLTTLGAEAELEAHTGASLNAGLRPEEIIEALLHAAIYCGIPRAINATLAAKKVLAERGLLPLAPDGGATGTAGAR